MTFDVRRRWLPITLLALTIAGGTYLRAAELGSVGFGPDELNHFFVAQSLERGEGPHLPSGEVYTRGIDVSRLVGLSVNLFGPSETAVRLPTAAFGVLNLVLFAAVLWALGGPWVAFWGTVLLAIYPLAVYQSRILRFYTYQLNFGLVALLAGWYAVRTFGSTVLPEPREVKRQWVSAAVAVLALLLAIRVQVVTLSVAAAWAAFVAFAAASDLYVRGWREWRRSVPIQLVMAGCLGIALAAAARPTLVAEILARSQMVPFWVQAVDGMHPLTYYYSLSERFPILVSLAPLLFLIVTVRRPRLGLFLATWFAVPLLLHSFVFPWKGERFILLAMPALFATAAFAASWGAGALYRVVHDAVAARPGVARFAGAAAMAAVAIVSVSTIVTTPAFNVTRKMSRAEGPTASGWKEAGAILRSRPDLAALPVGSASSLQPLFYAGRLDFTVDVSDDVLQTEDRSPAAWVKRAYEDEAPLDRKSGVPVLPAPDMIQARFAPYGGVVIVLDTGYVASGIVKRSLYRRLIDEAKDLCKGRCGATRAFLWHFDPPESDGTIAITEAAQHAHDP